MKFRFSLNGRSGSLKSDMDFIREFVAQNQGVVGEVLDESYDFEYDEYVWSETATVYNGRFYFVADDIRFVDESSTDDLPVERRVRDRVLKDVACVPYYVKGNTPGAKRIIKREATRKTRSFGKQTLRSEVRSLG